MTHAGRIAVVTGASQGIGKACATGLLKAGWHTVFVSRHMPALEAAIAEAGDVPAEALALACDVSKAEEVELLFEKIMAAFGRVDLLFNNAAVQHQNHQH